MYESYKKKIHVHFAEGLAKQCVSAAGTEGQKLVSWGRGRRRNTEITCPYPQPRDVLAPFPTSNHSRFLSRRPDSTPFLTLPLPSPLPAMAPCPSHASALRCTWEPELTLDRTTAKPLHPYSPPRERQVICAPKVKRSKLHRGVQEVSITAREGTQGFRALDSISPSASPHSTE